MALALVIWSSIVRSPKISCSDRRPNGWWQLIHGCAFAGWPDEPVALNAGVGQGGAEGKLAQDPKEENPGEKAGCAKRRVGSFQIESLRRRPKSQERDGSS